MNTKEQVLQTCERAKQASRAFAATNTKHKNKILEAISRHLCDNRAAIINANTKTAIRLNIAHTPFAK